MSDIRNRSIQGLKTGDTLTITRTFTKKDMIRFGNITRDYNPVHYDDRYSATKKFRDRICHGLLIGAMLTEIGGQIGWLASGMNFRFIQPVYFGDTIECAFTIVEIDPVGHARAEATYHNQEGLRVLEAELFGILPGDPEREVLRKMVAEGDPTNKLR